VFAIILILTSQSTLKGPASKGDCQRLELSKGVEKLRNKPHEAHFDQCLMRKQIITPGYKIQLVNKFFKVYYNRSLIDAGTTEVYLTPIMKVLNPFD
jgi:hypothetical protein